MPYQAAQMPSITIGLSTSNLSGVHRRLHLTNAKPCWSYADLLDDARSPAACSSAGIARQVCRERQTD